MQLSLAQQQIGEWLLAWATRMRTQSVPGLQQDVPGLNSPGREYSKVSSAKQSSVCGYAVGQFVIGKRRFDERKKEKGRRKLAGQVARRRIWARSLALVGAHGAKVTVLLDARSRCPD